MKRKVLCILLSLVMLLGTFGCSSMKADDLTKEFSPQSVSEKSSDDSFTTKQMDFTLKLFQNTVNETPNENVLISPLSVMLALSMTANGADSDTRLEMQQVLAGNFSIEELNEYLHTFMENLPSDKSSKLHIANSIWLRNDENLNVNADFLQICSSYYAAKVYKAAFDKQTVSDINHWVKENTDDMIDEILKEIPDSAMIYLINALSFDAEWDNIYQTTQIHEADFTSVLGEKNTVEMMSSSEYFYLDDGSATGFIKDYKDGAYQFVALLPNSDVDIYEYIASLNYETLSKTIQNASAENVRASLPKFSYDFSIKLDDILAAMGMPAAFDMGEADFSKLGSFSDQNLFLANVIHKTFISVDEKGTEAGAVTVAANFGASALMKIVELNRPFVYMIIDGESKLPVFIGAVMNI